jgi:hypothetical protein
MTIDHVGGHVSVIRDIEVELAAVAAGTAQARELLAEAVAATGRIAGHTAASGFTGIAQNMNRIRAAIGESHRQVAGVAAAVDTVRALAAQVPEQSSSRDAIATLGPVRARSDDVSAAVAAAIATVGAVRTQVAAALRGGEPGPMLRRLDTVGHVLAAVHERCGLIERHVAAAVGAAGQVGAVGNRSRASVYPYRGHQRPSYRLLTLRRSVVVCPCGPTARIRRRASSTGSG